MKKIQVADKAKAYYPIDSCIFENLGLAHKRRYRIEP